MKGISRCSMLKKTNVFTKVVCLHKSGVASKSIKDNNERGNMWERIEARGGRNHLVQVAFNLEA